MGLIAFAIFAVVVCVVVYVAVWLLGFLAPGHPAVIDRALWVLGVVIILWKLLTATGILAHDIPIPHL